MTWLGADVDRLHSFGLALERLHHELVPLSSVDPRVARALHLVDTDLDHVRRTWHQLSFGRMAAVEFDAWGADGAAWWTERFVASSTTADSILRRVIDNSAEQSFADRIRADVALLHGVSDFAVLADFWTRATDPNTVPVDIAGTRIRRMLDAIVIHRADRSFLVTPAGHQGEVEQRDRDIDQLLALVIAPWSLHFTALAHEWDWTPQDGLHRLHEMLAIPVVASAVAAGLPAAVDRALTDLPADEFARRRRIDDVAAGSGATIDAVGAAVLGRSTTPLDRLDDLVGFVPWGSWALGVAAGTTAATLVQPTRSSGGRGTHRGSPSGHATQHLGRRGHDRGGERCGETRSHRYLGSSREQRSRPRTRAHTSGVRFGRRSRRLLRAVGRYVAALTDQPVMLTSVAKRIDRDGSG